MSIYDLRINIKLNRTVLARNPRDYDFIWKNPNLRTFGSSFLGLPIVVARAHCFVSIKARRNTQALAAALLAEKHAWFVVLCPATPSCALSRAFCKSLYTKLIN